MGGKKKPESVLVSCPVPTSHEEKQFCIPSQTSWLVHGVTVLGWFSMSPLPRLHHHDIMTIVGLFFILTRHDKVLLSHFYTEKKKERREQFHSLTLTLTATLRPDYSTTAYCCRLQCKSATFNAPTLHDVRMVRIYMTY